MKYEELGSNRSYVPISISKKAIKAFGVDNQIDKLLEEMAELQDAILKHKRGRDTIDHVREEIADVRIMIAQMCVIFGTNEVYAQTKKKLERLEERIKEYKEKQKGNLNPNKAKQGKLDL